MKNEFRLYIGPMGKLKPAKGTVITGIISDKDGLKFRHRIDRDAVREFKKNKGWKGSIYE